ncbi:MAG TPA: polyamine ABC transporter substrate-binding protein [Bauldia sp.]|nr:polyamine ABC transporter substrate-binding protein [Bauldia sp.]
MRRRSGGLVLGLALAAGFAAQAAAEDRVVNVYNWSDYVGEGVLEDFTKATGIKVVYDVYDSMEVLETKLLAGGSGYDIVVPTDRNLARLIQAGVIAKLDKSKIPNLSHQWDAIEKRLENYDPGTEHSTDYMWGTTGIGYNIAKVKAAMPDAPVDSWKLVFDPDTAARFKDCGIYFLDSADDMFPAALAYLGLNPNSKEQADLEKAADLLAKVAPFVQKYNSSEYINALANGDICIAVGYSGDILQARDRAEEAKNGVEVGYSVPKEGALIWFDSFAIPADAPHPEEAHAFINFMLDPKIAARNSNYVYYANGNKDSQPLLDKEVIEDPSIYPPPETFAKLFTTTPNDPKVQRLVTRLWTKVKTGE